MTKHRRPTSPWALAMNQPSTYILHKCPLMATPLLQTKACLKVQGLQSLTEPSITSQNMRATFFLLFSPLHLCRLLLSLPLSSSPFSHSILFPSPFLSLSLFSFSSSSSFSSFSSSSSYSSFFFFLSLSFVLSCAEH